MSYTIVLRVKGYSYKLNRFITSSNFYYNLKRFGLRDVKRI